MKGWMVQSEVIAELVGTVERVGICPCSSLAGTVRQGALDEKLEKSAQRTQRAKHKDLLS